ncbi:MAG TPA: M48 family metallopeptidase [Terriglobia bacterium]|nr:M48 family metallopeptidase [Terriglobia bacterium]
MNLYEQQRANRRNTALVTAVFIAFFAFLGFGFDFFYFGFSPGSGPAAANEFGGEAPAGMGFPLATVLALLFGSGQAWWGLRFGDRAVLSSAGATPVDPSTTDPQQRQLLNIVEEMKIASGLPMPKVYIIPDPDPNAFATGRDPQNASIAVTRGLLEKLNREELQGVIAHEMSHIRNLDIRLMTTIAALVGGVVLLSDWAARSLRFGGSGRSSRRGKGGGEGAGMIFLVLWIIAVVLAPLLAQILAMAVSREREYLADATGAELTRNPLGLASALKKIEMDHAPTQSIKKGTAHLCIADPLGRRMGFREGFWADLLATHPPMPHRISKLMQMAYQASPAASTS